LSLSSKKQKAPVLSRGLNLKTKTGGFAPPAIVKLKGGSHERRLIAKLNITNFLNEKQEETRKRTGDITHSKI